MAELKAMGAHAIKLLEECVCEQSVTRDQISLAATQLDHAGLIRIRDHEYSITGKYQLTPSIAGEETLELLHNQIETGT